MCQTGLFGAIATVIISFYLYDYKVLFLHIPLDLHENLKHIFMKKLIVLSMVSGMLLSSCGVAGIVSTPSSYAKAGKEVSIVKKNTNVFGLTAMDTQAETAKALNELDSQCSNGITNITTTVSYKAFILGFEKLEMTANCK